MLRHVTKHAQTRRVCYYIFVGAFSTFPDRNGNMQTIAEMFAVQLAELKRIDEESNRKTQALLQRTRDLIKEIESIDLEIE